MRVILLHGAWHGAWCWFQIEKMLNYSGINTIAVELPGHGISKENPGNITLQNYVNIVDQIIDKKTIIVAHSMSGIVLSTLLEKYPDVTGVYLSAFAPANGKSLLDYAMTDIDSIAGKNLIVDEENKTVDINRECIIDAFYNECDTMYHYLARQLLTIEPLIPFTEKMVLGTKYKIAKKYYISTLLDHAISYDLQQQMINDNEIENIINIETDHSMFFSNYKKLAKILYTIIKKNNE